MRDRIDVHQHIVPPFWAEELRAIKSPHRPPIWSPASAIAFMDSQEIAKGILSLTAPGITGWSADALRDAARRVNDYTAEVVSNRPDRFGNFATLPLPDIDGALLEIERAFGKLKADGVVIFSNYGDKYLGDPLFEPLWSELDHREAIVFIHPTRLTQPELPGIPGAFVDFPFSTTRTAVDMVLKGVLDRHGKMRVILSHGGGFLPYAVYRFAFFAEKMPGSDDADTVLQKFRRFYLDTALSSSATALPSLKEFADPSHILFGSDFPYAPEGVAQKFTALLDATPLLSESEHAAIDCDNANRLFQNRHC